MGSWIEDELRRHRLDEKPKESESTGAVHKFTVKISLGGTTMQTAIFAENVTRARKIAEHLYGKKNIKGKPVKN